MKTKTIFRKFKNGDIIAVFPKLNFDSGDTLYPNLCMSYMLIGQHGECDYNIIVKKTIPAKKNEYRIILEQLKHIGYAIQIIKRRDSI